MLIARASIVTPPVHLLNTRITGVATVQVALFTRTAPVTLLEVPPRQAAAAGVLASFWLLRLAAARVAAGLTGQVVEVILGAAYAVLQCTLLL